jgi:CRISPR/Cas system-associated protein Cas10 (large subunit of type III CRISPR-Cas system)
MKDHEACKKCSRRKDCIFIFNNNVENCEYVIKWDTCEK